MNEIAEWLVAKAAALGFGGAKIEGVRVSEESDVITLVFTTDPADAIQLAMRLLSVLSGRNSYDFNVRLGRVIITFDGPAPWATTREVL